MQCWPSADNGAGALRSGLRRRGHSGMTVPFLVSPSLLSARLGPSVSIPFPCLRSAVIWKKFTLLLGTFQWLKFTTGLPLHYPPSNPWLRLAERNFTENIYFSPFIEK